MSRCGCVPVGRQCPSFLAFCWRLNKWLETGERQAPETVRLNSAGALTVPVASAPARTLTIKWVARPQTCPGFTGEPREAATARRAASNDKQAVRRYLPASAVADAGRHHHQPSSGLKSRQLLRPPGPERPRRCLKP